ncbi:putative condensin complex subunit 1 [Blattamonas nauphoetae]|uniref:Condensin complex subunit 1 n=1 Tax=Blattamonas nauphoetae TaxID=2049346 RepID=A0ABQ9YLN6_9EUKA|nr:putative condensin complex subunit 1 [Blattamonas nauphoetae]
MTRDALLNETDDSVFRVENQISFSSLHDFSNQLDDVESVLNEEGAHAFLNHSIFEPMFFILSSDNFNQLDNRMKNQVTEILHNSLVSLTHSILRFIQQRASSLDQLMSPPSSPQHSSAGAVFDDSHLKQSRILRNTLKAIVYLLSELNERSFDDFDQSRFALSLPGTKEKNKHASAQLESFEWSDRHFVRICDSLREVFQIDSIGEALWERVSNTQGGTFSGSISAPSRAPSTLGIRDSVVEDSLIRCAFNIPLRCFASPAMLRKGRVKAAAIGLVCTLHTQCDSMVPFIRSSLITLLFKHEHAPGLLREISETDEREWTIRRGLPTFKGKKTQTTQDKDDLDDSFIDDDSESDLDIPKKKKKVTKRKAKATVDLLSSNSVFPRPSSSSSHIMLSEALIDELLSMPDGFGSGDPEKTRLPKDTDDAVPKPEDDAEPVAEKPTHQASDLGSKNIGLFLCEMAKGCPMTMLKRSSEIIPNLGAPSHHVRSGIVEMCAELIKTLVVMISEMSKDNPQQQSEAEKPEGSLNHSQTRKPGHSFSVNLSTTLHSTMSDSRGQGQPALDLDQLNLSLDSFFQILSERINDVAAFTRARTLHCWTDLTSSQCLPLRFHNLAAALAVSRLSDKGSVVRRAAVQLLQSLVEFNPYNPKLSATTFSRQLRQLILMEEKEAEERSIIEAEIKTRLSERESRTEEEPNTIPPGVAMEQPTIHIPSVVDADDSNQKPLDTEESNPLDEPILSPSIRRGRRLTIAPLGTQMDEDGADDDNLLRSPLDSQDAEKTQEATDSGEVSIEALQQQLTVDQVQQKRRIIAKEYLVSASTFINTVETKGFPLVLHLIKSKVNTDVTNAISFCTLVQHFHFDTFETVLLPGLSGLIWSPDKVLKESCFDFFRELLGLNRLKEKNDKLEKANVAVQLVGLSGHLLRLDEMWTQKTNEQSEQGSSQLKSPFGSSQASPLLPFSQPTQSVHSSSMLVGVEIIFQQMAKDGEFADVVIEGMWSAVNLSYSAQTDDMQTPPTYISALHALSMVLPFVPSLNPIESVQHHFPIIIDIISNALHHPPITSLAASVAIKLVTKCFMHNPTLVTLLPPVHPLFAPLFAILSLCAGQLNTFASAEWHTIAHAAVECVFVCCADPSFLFGMFIPTWSKAVIKDTHTSVNFPQTTTDSRGSASPPPFPVGSGVSLSGSSCLSRFVFVISRISLEDAWWRERKEKNSNKNSSLAAEMTSVSVLDEPAGSTQGSSSKKKKGKPKSQSKALAKKGKKVKGRKGKKHNDYENEFDSDEPVLSENEDDTDYLDQFENLEEGISGMASSSPSKPAMITRRSTVHSQHSPESQGEKKDAGEASKSGLEETIHVQMTAYQSQASMLSSPPDSLSFKILSAFGGLIHWLCLREGSLDMMIPAEDEKSEENIDELNGPPSSQQSNHFQHVSGSSLLSAVSVQSLVSFMLLDYQYASVNMQLLFTLLQDSASPLTRGTLAIACVDIFTRYPSLASAFSRLLCIRIHDENSSVRRSALSSVVALTTSGMIKLRSHFVFVALCFKRYTQRSQLENYTPTPTDQNGEESKTDRVRNETRLISLSQLLIDSIGREPGALYNMLSETLVSLVLGSYMKANADNEENPHGKTEAANEDDGDQSAPSRARSVTEVVLTSFPKHIEPTFFLGLSISEFTAIAELLISKANLNERQVEAVSDRMMRAIRVCSHRHGKEEAAPLETINEVDEAKNEEPLEVENKPEVLEPSPTPTPMPSTVQHRSSSSTARSLHLFAVVLNLLTFGDRSSRSITTALNHPTLIFSVAQNNKPFAETMRSVAMKCRKVIRSNADERLDIIDRSVERLSGYVAQLGGEAWDGKAEMDHLNRREAARNRMKAQERDEEMLVDVLGENTGLAQNLDILPGVAKKGRKKGGKRREAPKPKPKKKGKKRYSESTDEQDEPSPDASSDDVELIDTDD